MFHPLSPLVPSHRFFRSISAGSDNEGYRCRWRSVGMDLGGFYAWEYVVVEQIQLRVRMRVPENHG